MHNSVNERAHMCAILITIILCVFCCVHKARANPYTSTGTTANGATGGNNSAGGGSVTWTYTESTHTLAYNYSGVSLVGGAGVQIFCYYYASQPGGYGGATWTETNRLTLFNSGFSPGTGNGATGVSVGEAFVFIVRQVYPEGAGTTTDTAVWWTVPEPPPDCPFKTYSFYINTTSEPRQWRVVIKEAGIVTSTVASGTVDVMDSYHAFTNTPVQTCGDFILQQNMGEDSWEDMPSDSPPPTREPDPPPVDYPTITDPSTATVPDVPNPQPTIPAQTVNGGMVEERSAKGILEVVRSMHQSANISAENSKTAAQAEAYNAARLQSIDTNIGILRRNSDEERADRSANSARMDEIKANTKKTADGVKELKDDMHTVSQIATGTHSSQTSFVNSAKLADAQSAAAGIAEYAGLKPGSTPGTVVIDSGTASWGNVTVGDKTIVFGFRSMLPEHDALFVAGRSILLAAICLGFIRQSSRLITEYTVALPQVLAQDTVTGTEVLVPGVGQAKTYATAAVAVGIIFVGAASMVALVDTFVTYYGGGVTAIFAGLNLPAAVGEIDRFVPMAPALSLTIMGVALPYLIAPLFLATAAVLRFIKT